MRLSSCIPALRFWILVLAYSVAGALNATAATKAVKFGKLWDGHSTIANAVVMVENDKIKVSLRAGQFQREWRSSISAATPAYRE